MVATPTTPTLTVLGTTVQLTATARDASNNAISGVTFTWASSDTTRVTVPASGLVTAVGHGTATITATVPGGVSGSATVTVSSLLGQAARLSGGGNYTCGLTTAGAAYCWGDNEYGQLGDGRDFRTSPVAVAGGLLFGAPAVIPSAAAARAPRAR